MWHHSANLVNWCVDSITQPTRCVSEKVFAFAVESEQRCQHASQRSGWLWSQHDSVCMPRHIHGAFEDSLDKTCCSVLLLKSPVVKRAGDRLARIRKAWATNPRVPHICLRSCPRVLQWVSVASRHVFSPEVLNEPWIGSIHTVALWLLHFTLKYLIRKT